MICAVDFPYCSVDPGFILRRIGKLRHREAHFFSRRQAEPVAGQRRAGRIMVGVQEKPGRVFISEGIADLPLFKVAAKARILHPFTGYARSPWNDLPVCFQKIGSGTKTHNSFPGKGKHRRMGHPVASCHPPGRRGKLLRSLTHPGHFTLPL